MAECDVCGSHEELPYQCRRCGNTFCAEHRLPENHDCPGLNQWNDPSGVFDSGFDDSVDNRGGGSSIADRITGTGGVLGYFRGNVTFLFLGLMWLTFLFQYFVFPFVLGAGSNTALWSQLFVLSPQNPDIAYAWTWLTSIFSHGGFLHIGINSLVLYFFGPVVERRLGSKRFVALFLVAGAFAGFAQLGVGFALSDPVRGVLGASGAIMALMGVLTVLNPGMRVYLYFVIPMPLWVLTIGFAGFSVLAGLGYIGGVGVLGGGGGVAHFAHLGGLVIGLVYGERVKGEARAPENLRFGNQRGGGRGPF
jgi:hypothetical protein